MEKRKYHLRIAAMSVILTCLLSLTWNVNVEAASYKTDIKKLVKNMDRGEALILSGNEKSQKIKLTKDIMARFAAMTIPYDSMKLIKEDDELAYYRFGQKNLQKAGKYIFGKNLKKKDITSKVICSYWDCRKTKYGVAYIEIVHETEEDYTVRSISVKKSGNKYTVTKKVYWGYWGLNDGKKITHKIIYTVKKNKKSKYGYVITGMKIKAL